MSAISESQQALDRFLNPLRDTLSVEAAREIANFRADTLTQERIEDLAHRHHEGQLTDIELAEYEALVHASNLIGILQAKARSAIQRRVSQ